MNFQLEKRKFACTAYCGHGLAPIPHIHKHIEIILMEKGKSRATAGAKEVLLEDGDLYIAFPNQIHYFMDESVTTEHKIVIASPDICPEFSREFKYYLPVTPKLTDAGKNPRILFAIDCLLEFCASNDKHSAAEIKGCLLILLSEFFKNIPLEEHPIYDTDLLTDIIHYCYDNYTEDISLESLAAAMHVSRFYVSHLFNERLHISFRDYINSLRIENACELIKASEQTLTEIAYAVGYNSTRTFDRCFQKLEGCTPREYQRRGQKAE